MYLDSRVLRYPGSTSSSTDRTSNRHRYSRYWLGGQNSTTFSNTTRTGRTAVIRGVLLAVQRGTATSTRSSYPPLLVSATLRPLFPRTRYQRISMVLSRKGCSLVPLYTCVISMTFPVLTLSQIVRHGRVPVPAPTFKQQAGVKLLEIARGGAFFCLSADTAHS